MMQELYYVEKIGSNYYYNLVLDINEEGILTTEPESTRKPLAWRDHVITRPHVVVDVARELLRLQGMRIDDSTEFFTYAAGLEELESVVVTLFEWDESAIGHVPDDVLVEAMDFCRGLKW